MDFLRRFLYGRYGNDELNKSMLGLGIVLLVAEWLTGWKLISAAVTVILALCYFRMFSRNISARTIENRKFLAVAGPVIGKLKSASMRISDRKEHKYYKCPGCKMRLRVPKGKGKISIECPHCHTRFIKKT